MKNNLFLGLGAVVCVATLANAADNGEKSGVFAGFEIGAGETRTYMYEANDKYIHNAKQIVPQFGGKVGYKHFFNDTWGIRGYLAVNYNIATRDEELFDESNAILTNPSVTKSEYWVSSTNTSLLTYTANIDILYNFHNDGGGISVFLQDLDLVELI